MVVNNTKCSNKSQMKNQNRNGAIFIERDGEIRDKHVNVTLDCFPFTDVLLIYILF